MSRPRRWSGGLALLGWAACSEAERPRYVTEHLEVELYDGEEICAGTLAAMDGQVERIAAVLGIVPPAKIRVYYGPSAVKEHCGGTWNGCARASGVYANDDSIFHELVHAVRYEQGGGVVGTWLFEEGFAEVLSGYRWDPYYVQEEPNAVERGPAILAGFPRGEGKFVPEDYPTAGHFVSWLRATYGDATLVGFLNDERYLRGGTADDAFVEHFKMTIDDADKGWRMSAPSDYLWSEVCDPAYALTWDGPTLEFSDSADCEAPHTTGPSGYLDKATLRSHCFSLAQAQTVRVEFISNGGWLRLVPVDCVDDGALAPEFYASKPMKGGETQELGFAACTWEVEVDGIAGLTQDFTLRLTQL